MMIVFTFLTLVFCFLKASTGAVLPRQSEPPLPPLITLEEHFTSAEALPGQYVVQPPWIIQKLRDLDSLRLEEMDQGKITKQ